jgi:2-iminoacetate synthase
VTPRVAVALPDHPAVRHGRGFDPPEPEVTFAEVLAGIPFDRLRALADSASLERVAAALARSPVERSLDDFAALLSPAADASLEELADASHRLTVARFGNTMRMYAPLYLSNECLSACTYCGFARELPIARKTLSAEETLEEARSLLARGFRSLLLLTGEHERLTGVGFLEERIRLLADEVPSLSIEVQVWSEAEYRRLLSAGCEGVVAYQETYHQGTYAAVHLAGRKRHFEWRLLGPERAARAGARRVGLGALLGLHGDWRFEAIAMAAHARFLMKRFWRTQFTLSVPRLRPSASGWQPRDPIGDRELARLVCALRLNLPDAGIVLSTRESPILRDGLFRIGVTHASAGSHTEPGGYTHPKEAAEQFEVADLRSPSEVGSALRSMGYDPIWGDWSSVVPATESMLARPRGS